MKKQPFSGTFLKIFLPVTIIVSAGIIIVTLLFSQVFGKNTVSVLTREYRKNLNMIRNMYTEIHFAVVPSALYMLDDMRIRNFLFSHNFQYDIALSGLAEIDKTHTLNKYVHSIYLYNQDFGFLSTFKGYRDLKNTSDPSLNALLQNPDFKLNSMLPRRALFEGEEKTENLFSFIYGGLDEKSGSVAYAFVFNLSESKIRKMLVSDTRENEDEFYIIDSKGTYLSHPDPAQFNESSEKNDVINHILHSSAQSGSEFVSGAGEGRHLAIWSDQNELGWRFLYLIPEHKIFAQLTSLRNALFFTAAGVLLFSLSLLVLMTLRIQKSVEFEKKLVNYVQGFSDLPEKIFAGKKIYAGVFRCDLTGTAEKADRYSVKLRRHDWLTGELNRIRTQAYCVHVYDNLYCTLSVQPFFWYDSDFYSLRQKMVTEFLSEVTAVYAASAVLFDEIPALYICLMNELRNTYMVSQGLSRKISYFSGNGASVEHKIPEEFDFVPMEHAFRSMNTEKITAEANRLESFLIEKKDYFVFKTSVTQTGLLASRVFGKSLDLYLSGGMDGWRNELFQCEQVSAFSSLLKILLQSISGFCDLQIGSNYAKMTRYIKNYVISNIHDKNLNSALISAALGLSLNYVREIFKKAEKMSINEYIGLYRVELAKQYLTGTDKTVSEICDIVGFSNYSYFCTYFKKTEGISPSEFRINMRISK